MYYSKVTVACDKGMSGGFCKAVNEFYFVFHC